MRLPSSLLSIALAAALVSLVASPASASRANDAEIVIDANTGRTLYSASADAPRYPASLTKMMTLYLTFDALKAGKIGKNTRMPVSANAAAQAPSKLGLKAGQTITVEAAILSLVTKSANDSAMVLGEYLGGSQAGFARMMTAKARKLGMSRTTFRNPNGLPDLEQKTTARDMAILGIALRQNHPQYYGYFSTRSFTYGGRKIGNHNRLLGRVTGVDGIKTGYTRLSGFNLVSSVAVGDRKIVAVVMGGESGRSRDNRMAQLIRTYLPKASARKSRDVLVASAGDAPEQLVQAPAREIQAAGLEAPVPTAKPIMEVASVQTVADVVEAAYAEPEAEVEAPAAPAVDPVRTASTAPAGAWAIQIASADSEKGARALLGKASRQAGPLLADASAFTQTFDKGGKRFYRARFGGFSSKNDAWDTCGALKKRKIACYAVQQ